MVDYPAAIVKQPYVCGPFPLIRSHPHDARYVYNGSVGQPNIAVDADHITGGHIGFCCLIPVGLVHVDHLVVALALCTRSRHMRHKRGRDIGEDTELLKPLQRCPVP